MDMTTANAIGNYLHTVVADAVKTEERENDVQWQFAEINGAVVLAIKSGYLRVRRRILYRLSNKFEKNFGMPLCVVGIKIQEIPETVRVKYDALPLGGYGLDPNFSVARWDIFGKANTLRDLKNGPLNERLLPGKSTEEYLADLLDWQRAYHKDPDLDHPRFKTWEEFLLAWNDLYGIRLQDTWNISTTYRSSDFSGGRFHTKMRKAG